MRLKQGFSEGAAFAPLKGIRKARGTPRFDQLSRGEFFARRYKEPFIIRSRINEWTLFTELKRRNSEERQLAYLKTIMGTTMVNFATIPASKKGELGFTPDLRKSDFKFVSPGGKKPFSFVCGAIGRVISGESDKTIYMASVPIRNFPNLRDKLGKLPFVGTEVAVDGDIWVGSGGHVANLHYDGKSNFIIMVAGKKRVTLFPFHTLPFMYPAPLDRGLNSAPSSFVRLLDPDFKRFPMFKRALREARVVVLEPGDILYVPGYWWHCVEASGLNVTINHWTGVSPQNMRLLENQASAMVLFDQVPRQTRRALRQAFVEGPFGARSGDIKRKTKPFTGRHSAGVDADLARQISDHFAETIRIHRVLPEVYRSINKIFYDHYVFQMNGDPVAALPGEFSKMVERIFETSPAPRVPRVGWEFYRKVCLAWAKLNGEYLDGLPGGKAAWLRRMNISRTQKGPLMPYPPARDIAYMRRFWSVVLGRRALQPEPCRPHRAETTHEPCRRSRTSRRAHRAFARPREQHRFSE